MPKKGKKRRERERARRLEASAERPETAAEPPVARSQGPAERPPRKKARKKASGAGFRLRSWMLAAPAVAAVAALVFFVATSGSSGDQREGVVVTPSPDARLAGQEPGETLQVDARGGANDAFFSPASLTVSAGEVFEVQVRNTGSVAHNLRISGEDGQYRTPDDWVTIPTALLPGAEGTLLARLDAPGTYPFQCDFHPLIQTGTITVR